MHQNENFTESEIASLMVRFSQANDMVNELYRLLSKYANNENPKAKYRIDFDDFINIDFNGKNTRLYRIIALIDLLYVKAGDKGGYVQGYHNLSQQGGCWLYDQAIAYHNAQVIENARLFEKASAWGNAIVKGNTVATHSSSIGDNAIVGGDTLMYDKSLVRCSAIVTDSTLKDEAHIGGVSVLHGGEVFGKSYLYNVIALGDFKIVSRGITDVGTKTVIFGKTELSLNSHD